MNCKRMVTLSLVSLLLLGTAGSSASDNNRKDPVLRGADLFSDRDLNQTAERTGATVLTVSDGADLYISGEGVYCLSGKAREVTVYVDAGKKDQVQLVLDGLEITNADEPCIFVQKAGKVFITLEGQSRLSVGGPFREDGDSKADGVIWSKKDLTLNGTGSLTVESSDCGIVSKDNLSVTGGDLRIDAKGKAARAKDSIRIAGGRLNLHAGDDGLHAENGNDTGKGFVYIGGGSLTIESDDDAIHSTSLVQIDDGDIRLTAWEGIEAALIQINGGTLEITAADDGMNATRKSEVYPPTVVFNGGETTMTIGAGDADGVDSNGDIFLNGGSLRITAKSPFDYRGIAEYNGGTLLVNGEPMTEEELQKYRNVE